MTAQRSQRVFEMVFRIALLLTIVIAGFGRAVMELWNWLVPGILGLRPLSFWQAVGVMSLSWILFGGLRGFGMLAPASRSRADRLTPEELERFRRGIALERSSARVHSDLAACRTARQAPR